MAMTLYEMATGVLPCWGDGQSDPALLDCDVSLDSALFDPAIRDALSAFFATALHRDYRQRFDNAEEMRRPGSASLRLSTGRLPRRTTARRSTWSRR